jgi:hypothetical protein
MLHITKLRARVSWHRDPRGIAAMLAPYFSAFF